MAFLCEKPDQLKQGQNGTTPDSKYGCVTVEALHDSHAA